MNLENSGRKWLVKMQNPMWLVFIIPAFLILVFNVIGMILACKYHDIDPEQSAKAFVALFFISIVDSGMLTYMILAMYGYEWRL